MGSEKTGTGLSRRAFLQAGALSAAAAGLAACSPQNKVEEVERVPVGRIDADIDPVVDGEWVPVQCSHNCGGRCANYAYVVDGVVVRQKTDDTHEDTLDDPQQRGCLRGRSQRRHFFGPDRLKYPMKRKHWEPLTGGRKELRGIDEWERISWDEALDLVATEMRHIIDTSGSDAIMLATTNLTLPGHTATMDALGGSTILWHTGSEGVFRFSPAKFYGFTGYPDQEGSDRFEMLNVDTVVFYGANPAWASGGNTVHFLNRVRDNGARFVSVGPMRDTTACMFDADWIPVRVGTDCAFLAAVAYVMLEEDDPDSNPLIDWDFIDRCTIGFDDERMPDDASLQENFKGYVLGSYDGTPKTPEWATEICGTPVDQIRSFARLLAKDNKVYLGWSLAPARQKGSESFPQMLMTVAAMGGHFGKTGHGCSAMYYAQGGNDGPQIVRADNYQHPVEQKFTTKHCINACEMWDAVVDGTYTSNGPGARIREWEPGVKKDVDIKMLWFSRGAPLATSTDMRKGIEAFRTVDFVLNQSWTYRAEAQFADIILPVTSPWETFMGVDEMHSYKMKSREFMFFPRKAVDPYFESRTDRWIFEQILDRMGIDPAGVFTRSDDEVAFANMANARIQQEGAAEPTPLISFTQEDIEELGVQGDPQDGVVSYQEIKENGYYPVKRSRGDEYEHVGFKDFYEDPEGNPRPSKSGKMEIYSDTYADLINNMGFSDSMRIKPYPTYIPCEDNYAYTFENHDIASGVKGEYPLQVFNPHYLRSAHATLGNVDWLQEAMPQPAYVSAVDAAERGVETGDTILIHNARGKILRKACVTERIMPGTLAVSHGGWIDWDEENGVCRGGSENMISGGTSVSGVHAYNSCLVDFQRYDGDPLEDDCMKPRRVVAAQEVE